MNRYRGTIFSLLIFLIFIPGEATGEPLSLSLSQLEQWLDLHSSELKLSTEEEDLKKLEEYMDAGLTPSNPEFSFKNESLNEGSLRDREQEFELSKSFSTPWIYAARRTGWKYMKQSVRLSANAYRNRRVSEMRAGYTGIVLLRKNVREYRSSGKILQELYKSLKGKEKEGFISQLNLRMIRLAISNLEIRTMEIESLLEHKEKEWKQAAGISPGTKLIFTTAIRYIPARGSSLEELLALYRSSPGYRKWDYSGRALKEKVKAEKLGFFPEFTLGVGFKKIKDGPEGPTFGVSFGIPLLNRNTVMVKKAKLENNIHNSRKDWELQSEKGEITLWYSKMGKYEDFLKKIKDPPVNPSKEILPLLDAFNEGVMDANGLISGIQLYLEGMENYHSALAEYYSNVFRIQGRTGRNMVPIN